MKSPSLARPDASRRPGTMIGLGCMRLSTAPDREEARAVRVIHAALDAGVRLLDTADAYCHDESDVGHNERLVARALASWAGDRSSVEVATKGGLRRPGGNWTPDGRAGHLRSACEASLRALGVDAIDCYQLHVVDPRTALRTSVRALAALQAEGLIRRIGLCNVSVAQLQAALDIADIASVQVSLGAFDHEGFRSGVAEACRDRGIRLIAYRPLGGDRAPRLARDRALAAVAADHGATPAEIALAWLLDLGRGLVPIPGATREETARSIGRAAAIELTDRDRERLDARFPAGLVLRVPRADRRPAPNADGDVVLVMGIPAAGKSAVARGLERKGYARLNRDSRGGTLADLVPELAAGLARGERRWVLDNTYPTRSSRSEVIECAWRAGVPVRCVWLQTGIADAQINAVERMVEAHGRLPTPAELRELGRQDPHFFGPDAQFRYERALEAPVVDEGFEAVEERAFSREPAPGRDGRAVVLEFDGVLCSSTSGAAVVDPADVVIAAPVRERLAHRHADGWRLFAQAWRPQVAAGTLSASRVEACFERARELLRLPIDLACCPHAAGRPVCWCRKPLPGLVLEFARRAGVSLERSLVVGRAPADRTLARRLGAAYVDGDGFVRSDQP